MPQYCDTYRTDGSWRNTAYDQEARGSKHRAINHQKDFLHEYEKRIIIELSRKVINSIAFNHKKVQKAGEIMGGKVLDLEADKWLEQYKKALKKGREEGR